MIRGAAIDFEMADCNLVEGLESLGACMCNPMNVSKWKNHWQVFMTEAWCGTTPMSKSAGEGKDWVQEMTVHPPIKDEVNIALSKMTRQPTKHLLKKDVGWVPSKKKKRIGSYGS